MESLVVIVLRVRAILLKSKGTASFGCFFPLGWEVQR
jgi:hypothetical protein